MTPMELFSSALEAPRGAAYNLGRSLHRGFSGEGTIDDLVSAFPGALGIIGGAALAPFTGGASIPIGAALAGGAQLGGKLMGDERYDAATPSELLKALGGDPENTGASWALGMATDPLTYLGGLGAFKGGKGIAGLFKGALPEAAEGVAAKAAGTVADAAGKTAVRGPAGLAALGEGGGETAALLRRPAENAAMLLSPERKALEAAAISPLESTVPVGPYRPSLSDLGRSRAVRPPSPSSLDIGFEAPFSRSVGGSETMVAPTTGQSSELLKALTGPDTLDQLRPTTIDRLFAEDTLSPLARGGSGARPVLPLPGRRQASLMSQPGKAYRIPPPSERFPG